MKITISEKQLDKLIKEDLGVSRAGLAYTNFTYYKLEPIVKDFLNNKKNQNLILTIPVNEMSYIYQSSMDDYIDLPIEKLTINIKTITNANLINDIPFSTGGAAESIQKEYKRSSFLKQPSLELPKYILEEIDKTIVAKIEISIYLGKSYEDTMEEKLLFDLRDTITHEFNHIYEFYKRAEKGAKQINASLSYVGLKNFNIKKEIFEVWEDFMDYVYNSEPYEINAKVQEAFSLRSRMSFDKFKESKNWKSAMNLKSFNGDIFFEHLLNVIDKYSPNKKLSILNNLYKWFFNDYYKVINFLGEKPKRYIEKSKHLYDLIKRFEPVINKAGETLLRKYMRLYSIELED